jgi:hypothetical protein
MTARGFGYPQVWSDRMVGILRRVAADGGSARDASIEIGYVSRNSVIGKARRIGVTFASKKVVANRKKEAVDVRAKVEKVATFVRDKPALIVVPAHPEPEPEQPAEPKGQGVGFMELRRTSCRRPLWPHEDRPAVEDQRYCGEPIDGLRPYCKDCASLLYTPAHSSAMKAVRYK